MKIFVKQDGEWTRIMGAEIDFLKWNINLKNNSVEEVFQAIKRWVMNDDQDAGVEIDPDGLFEINEDDTDTEVVEKIEDNANAWFDENYQNIKIIDDENNEETLY